MPRLLEDLAAIVGTEHVLCTPEAVGPYLKDWRNRYQGSTRCVVRPGSTEEVAAVVAACAANGTGIVPQGGNTGLVGGGIPKDNEVLVSLARLNRIRQLDADNYTMTVEAGCILQHVQDAAANINRLFPLSLGAEGSATIGGNISTNAGGVQVLRYGNMRDLVLGVEVVLADGRIWHGLRALRKDNTGYDLKHLFIGAEGTLGLVTAAVLKLFPRPQAELTAWLQLPSPAAAVALLSILREHCGERITAFELIDQASLQLIARHLPQIRVPSQGAWQVLLELSDAWPNAPLQHMLNEVLSPLLAQGAVLDAEIAGSGLQAQALWQIRESIPEAQKREGFSVKHDISMPISAISSFIASAESALRAAFPEIRIVCFGHVGDGNLHYNISTLGDDSSGFLRQGKHINRIVHDLVHASGGSISAEHGIGQLKIEELKRYKHALELELMRSIKNAVDPRSILNPDKLLDN